MVEEKEQKNTMNAALKIDGAVPSPRSPREKNPRRGRRSPRREGRVRSEFDQKIVKIRRVTRVVAGGRRFSFSVAIVLGNRKGSVGVGLGKASDTALAIEKASKNAKKNMIAILLSKESTSRSGKGGSSIPHEVFAKYGASEVVLMPTPGKGLTAGSSVRAVLELGGVSDVTAKVLSRSKNQLNNARATVKALRALKTKNEKQKTH